MSLAGLKKQFNKANQFMSEKIGGAEKSQVTEEFVENEKRTDATNIAVEDILNRTKEFLHPNPMLRAKLSTARTMNKMRGQSSANRYPQSEGTLGECFHKHGQELGEKSLFGVALRDCGDSMKHLSESKDALEYSVTQNFIEPLEHLKEKDLKEIMHHRKKLESRRLDYDCKKRKQAKGGSNVTDDELASAEDKFDESLQLVQVSMTNLLESEEEQIGQLHAFVEAQVEFHKQAVDILSQLTEVLSERMEEAANQPKSESKAVTLRKSSSFQNAGSKTNGDNDYNFTSSDQSNKNSYDFEPQADTKRQCKSLYDFDPENEGELGFSEGDIITDIEEIDENWLQGVCRGKSGYFPKNYVEYVD